MGVLSLLRALGLVGPDPNEESDNDNLDDNNRVNNNKPEEKTERTGTSKFNWYEWHNASAWHTFSTDDGTFGLRFSIDGMTKKELERLEEQLSKLGIKYEEKVASRDYNEIRKDERTLRVLDDGNGNLEKLLTCLRSDDPISFRRWQRHDSWKIALVPGDEYSCGFPLEDLTIGEIVAFATEMENNHIRYGWGDMSAEDGRIFSENLYVCGDEENLRKLLENVWAINPETGKRRMGHIPGEEKIDEIREKNKKHQNEKMKAGQKPTIVVDFKDGSFCYNEEKYNLNNLPDDLIMDANVDLFEGTLFRTQEELNRRFGDEREIVPDLSKVQIKGHYNIIGAKLENLDYLPKCDYVTCDVEQAKLIMEKGSKELKEKTRVLTDNVHFDNEGKPEIKCMCVKLNYWAKLLSYIDVNQQVGVLENMERLDRNSKGYQTLDGLLHYYAMPPSEKRFHDGNVEGKKRGVQRNLEDAVMEKVGTPPGGKKDTGKLPLEVLSNMDPRVQ